MRFILELIIMALAVMLAAYLLPGVEVRGFWGALLAAVLIAFMNTILGGILRILTFPINILTLGLMSFIITVLMIMLVDSMMDSFNSNGFWTTALFAIVLALVKMIFGKILEPGRD